MWTPKIPEPIGLQVIMYIDCDAVIMQCSTTVKVKMMSKRIFAQSSFTATFRRIYVSAFFTHDRLLELKKPFCN